ncbi:MAG: hypothetical protein K2Y32_24355 [Candidatus Obscuribacterales bacterium]|jgi:hypothetical protein|nr:hypothetical protein [Candidatus Obscuribacterales bacterium]
MRTVTVKEAADALGLTTRAITSRLAKGDLKGTQKTNAYGVKEWRIYPTKEIASKMKLDQDSDVGENDFPPLEEAVDAETIYEEVQESQHQTWVEEERSRLRLLAEEMMKPLVETIRSQEQQLQEQSRQLKLLPDFQKQAEDERKAAHLKAVEAAALEKQIEALKAEKEESDRAKEQVAALEQSLKEQERVKNQEIEALKAEKDAQLKAVEEQLSNLSKTVLDLKKPWWQKLFSAPPAEQ